MGGIAYKEGPLQLQFVSDSYRENGSNEIDDGGNNHRGAPVHGDLEDPDRIRYRFHASGKYNNGRFFWNGEADWFLSWRSGEDTALGHTAGSLVEEGYNADGWLYGTEFGFLAGPVKATFNYVRSTGDDTSTRDTWEDSRGGDSGVSDGYMRDWGYLMYHLYGTGTGFGANGFGFPIDFHHVGARLDYAVASNLNLWAVFSKSWRDQPAMWMLGGDGRYGVLRINNDAIASFKGIPGAGNPEGLPTADVRAVPDHARDIGWECMFGVDWKLLENLTWYSTFAYWQPGNWWGYAFPNTAAIYNLNGNPDIAANGPYYDDGARVNPDREIDPLIAIETKLIIDF